MTVGMEREMGKGRKCFMRPKEYPRMTVGVAVSTPQIEVY